MKGAEKSALDSAHTQKKWGAEESAEINAPGPLSPSEAEFALQVRMQTLP